ncbi:hypothetical protein [Alkalibaculum sporogenes]|uniref:hypothetical protein n=1 Tax=Alkalibaculum sporogenes TaxID=2655001 RepID=UPI00128E67B8|nr:hypothetical protein [Alkalibaculum sporogenes]
MIILVVSIYIIIALYQVPNLIKRECMRDLSAFCFFYTIALVLSILYVLDVKIPSPISGMELILDKLQLHY